MEPKTVSLSPAQEKLNDAANAILDLSNNDLQMAFAHFLGALQSQSEWSRNGQLSIEKVAASLESARTYRERARSKAA